MQPGSIDVWLADVDAAGTALDDLETQLALLPEPERARAAGMAGLNDRLRWIRGRVALRLVLALHVGVTCARAPFAVSARGKPVVATAGLDFSLSHSGSLLLVATSDCGPVGADLECRATVDIIGRRRAAIERMAAELAPHAPLPAAPGAQRFVQAWVRLEAVGKATSTGIGHVLELAIRAARVAGDRQAATAEAMLCAQGRRLRVEDLALPSATAAAVALPREAELTLRSFPSSADGVGALAASARRRG